MRSLKLAASLAFLFTLSAAPAFAADDPQQIEARPLEQISALGQEIYRQDVAAWVTSDAFVAWLNGRTPTGAAGWIVVRNGDDQIVRFVRKIDGVLSTGWDVPVVRGEAGAVVETEAAPLSFEESEMFNARQTALAADNPMRCAATVNTAVTREPQGQGWLVWILTPMPASGVVPMGGHQRLVISEDGKTILRRDFLSAGCMNLKAPAASAGAPAALAVTTIVSDRPTEAHVFLSLQHRLPIYVGTPQGLMYAVEGPNIRKVDLPVQ